MEGIWDTFVTAGNATEISTPALSPDAFSPSYVPFVYGVTLQIPSRKSKVPFAILSGNICV